MFDDLSQKLDGVLGKFRQRGVLTEPMVRDGLREVRRVLLEADVHYQVTREFLKRVQEKALGDKVLKSVSPGQQIVKIVHDELVTLLGGEAPSGLAWAAVPPTVILVVGLQGSGKTTTLAKLAKRLARQGKKPLMAACDLYRPAAVDQLADLGAQMDLPVFRGEEGEAVLSVARAALSRARADRHQVLLVDTAGRLQIDEPMMDELRALKEALSPQEILLVADAMTGQEAVNIAQGFDEALALTGVILTKMDGDARGGAALSIYGVTGKPIKFVGVGEGVDALDSADPHRLAGRILQMGDVVGLVERAQASMDMEEQARLEQKVLGKGRFTLEDFLSTLRQIQKMGPLEQLVKLIPGVGAKLPTANMDPRKMKHIEAIILSMTPEERRRPEILNGSRRARIARGSGRPVSEVNRLLKQFKEMQKIMKQVRGFLPV
ncbi:MAG: signal recognition particle protein [Longimicrobiales bacterium]